MRYFGVKLNAKPGPLSMGHGGNRTTICLSGAKESLWKLSYLVSVTHPNIEYASAILVSPIGKT